MSTMNKDNLIFAVFGLLLGFIAGYLMHEVMAARQPPRLAAGTAPVGPMGQGAAATGAPGGPQAGGDPGAPAMQEVQQLQAHLQQNPNDADAMRRLADLHFDIQSWEKARELYSRYLELRPGDPDVLSDLGVSLRGLRQYDRALELFDEAQRVSPGHWQSRYNEAVVLAFDLQRFDAAQQVVDELKQLQPDNQNVAQLAAEIDRQRNAA